MAASVIHKPLYMTDFKNAGEIYLYMKANPEVVDILRNREWWDDNESNPLHTLLLLDTTSSDNSTLSLKTAVGMLKALLSFQPKKEAIYCQLEKAPFIRPRGDTLGKKTLVIFSKYDPKDIRKISSTYIRATPLQIAAFNAPKCRDLPLIELLLEHGCDPKAKGILYNSTPDYLDAADFAARNKNYFAKRLILNYTKPDGVQIASSNVVATLTAKVTEKPKMEAFLHKRAALAAQLAERHQDFIKVEKQLKEDLLEKKKELVRLEEELDYLTSSCSQVLAAFFEDPAFCSEAKERSTHKELQDIKKLLKVMKEMAEFEEEKLITLS